MSYFHHPLPGLCDTPMSNPKPAAAAPNPDPEAVLARALLDAMRGKL